MTSPAPPAAEDAASMVYVTCGSREEALILARSVVTERLAACANILDGMHSIYWWQGEISEDDETVVVFKTAAQRVAALTERILALHSYDVPCVVEIPLGGGNAAYFDWIAAETAPR